MNNKNNPKDKDIVFSKNTKYCVKLYEGFKNLNGELAWLNIIGSMKKQKKKPQGPSTREMIMNLQNTVTEGFRSVNARLDEHDQRFDRLENRLTNLENKVDNVITLNNLRTE